MAPSQRSAENFNKKLAAKAKRGIVSTGASSNKGTVDPKSLKPKELPCPHCDRLFKQQDRLKQHVAKHHASEVAEAATEAAKETPKVENTAADKAGSSSSSKRTEQWEWNGQPQATVFRATTKDPKTILSEYISKKRDVRKPKYTLKEEPNGKGWTCKVVIPDKYKPDKDTVIFSDVPCPNKDEAAQRGAVAALAKVANNLPLHRLLPSEYKQVFLDIGEREKEKAEKVKRMEEERERRAKMKPKENTRQELHMSEEKRNLVEDLLRDSALGGAGGGDTDVGDMHDDDDSDEVLTLKLTKLGFEEMDVAVAMRSVRTKSENAALDWLCLNVPEGRLPTRFAPNAKNEPILLMDPAAMFVPAGVGRITGKDPSSFRSVDTETKINSRVFSEPRPSDPNAAYLYDRGFGVWDAENALKQSDGCVDKAHVVLFRGVLQDAVPKDDLWVSWPSGEAAQSEGSPDSNSIAEDDPWEDEAIALEAIVGDDKFTRVSGNRFQVTIESSIGNVTLEVTRPDGNLYPGSQPPLLALSNRNADGESNVTRGALRAATESIAAAAAASAEDGATCVYELIEIAAMAIEEHEHAQVTVRTATAVPVSTATGDWSAVDKPPPVPNVSTSSDVPETNAIPAPRSTVTKPKPSVPRTQKPNPKRGRAPQTKEFTEKENVRLKQAFDLYFQNGGSVSSKQMVASRNNLPASGSREEVVKAVDTTPVVILSGETGCGKSTQVPQFILESEIHKGKGGGVNIVCTQPRRISAIGLAERVANERLEKCGDVVGYSVRLESKLSDKTRLHFCTMGILLRRLLGDPLLTGITHVVLDEVHERSVESDLLLLLLRKLLKKRTDLRIVLMSATADADFFSEYFTKPNRASLNAGIVSTKTTKVFIKGFTHPVREYFLEDALEMTGFLVGKASKWAVKKNNNSSNSSNPKNTSDTSEASLPEDPKKSDSPTSDNPSDVVPEDWEDDQDRVCVLSKVTQVETNADVNWEVGGSKKQGSKKDSEKSAAETRERARQDELAEASRKLMHDYSDATQRSFANIDESLLNYDLIEQLIGSIIQTERANGEHALVAPPAPGKEKSSSDKKHLGAILIFLPGQMEITRLIRNCERSRYLEEDTVGPLQFLPLYGALSSNDQRKIFAKAPLGVRKIVVATNIAETSVTIDDVRYVIDTGRAKEMGYDSTRGLSVLADAWISRAASMQRRGRAGRTAPGACFAMFSRKSRANLTPHQPPEMLRTPLQQLCLNIKALSSGDGQFSSGIQETLASAPTPPAVEAVKGALTELINLRALDPVNESLTPLGKHIAHMPVDARIGKMLLFGALLGCLDPILTIAAAMAGRPVFVSPKDSKKEADLAKKKLAVSGKSDHLTVANAYKEWYKSGNMSARRKFCAKNFLSMQALEGVQASRADYAAVLADLGFVSRDYLHSLKREGAGGGVADRNSNTGRVVKAALVAGFYPHVVNVKHPSTKFVQTAGGTVERESRDGRELKFYCKDVGRVFLHPSSTNNTVGKYESPWLVFSERVETGRIYIRDNTMVGVYALLLFGGDITVDHERSTVSMDGGWATFNAPARIGVLVREMRGAVDRLLDQHIDKPIEHDEENENSLSNSKVVKAVLELLATEGF